MNQLKNIQFVTSFFFYVLGVVMFGLVLLMRNKMYGEIPLVALKTLDLPFMLAAMGYGLSSLRIVLGDDIKSDMVDAILMFVGAFGLVILLYLNFGFEDFI